MSATVWPRRSSAWFIAAAIVLLSHAVGHAQTTESPFVADAGLQFTYSGKISVREPISFWLASKSGDLSGVTVRVEQVKAPDGQLMSPDSLKKPQINLGKLTTVGQLISFQPDPQRLLRPGDYRIRLSLKSSQPAGAGTVELIIKRTAAEINLDELKDTTFELTRNPPWGTASGPGVLDLSETAGGAIADLKVEGRTLSKEGSKVQVPGEIRIGKIASGMVPPTGHEKINLSFLNIQDTGTFTTNVVVSSPSLPQPRPIPLKIVVKDPWGWALLVIALGVLGGFLTHSWVQTWRPRQLNTYKIFSLRRAIELLESEAADKKRQLDNLRQRLDEVEEQNVLGESAAAATKLTQIEQDFSALRKQWADERETLAKDLAALQRKVENLPPEDSKKPRLEKEIEECWRLLKRGEFAAAGERAEALRKELGEQQGASAQELEAVTGPQLIVDGTPEDWTTDSPIVFRVLLPGQNQSKLRWHFGEAGSWEDGGVQSSHRYSKPGRYEVKVEITNPDGTIQHLTTNVQVSRGKTESQLMRLLHKIQFGDLLLSLIALLLATLTGLLYLYIGKPFGSLAEYIGAFIWGFGIDNSVRGFAAVLQKISA